MLLALFLFAATANVDVCGTFKNKEYRLKCSRGEAAPIGFSTWEDYREWLTENPKKEFPETAVGMKKFDEFAGRVTNSFEFAGKLVFSLIIFGAAAFYGFQNILKRWGSIENLDQVLDDVEEFEDRGWTEDQKARAVVRELDKYWKGESKPRKQLYKESRQSIILEVLIGSVCIFRNPWKVYRTMTLFKKGSRIRWLEMVAREKP